MIDWSEINLGYTYSIRYQVDDHSDEIVIHDIRRVRGNGRAFSYSTGATLILDIAKMSDYINNMSDSIYNQLDVITQMVYDESKLVYNKILLLHKLAIFVR